MSGWGSQSRKRGKKEMIETVSRDCNCYGIKTSGHKKIANNTLQYDCVYADGRRSYRVRLHNTDVFECFLKNGKPSLITLNTGGWWPSRITGERINDALWNLSKGKWHYYDLNFRRYRQHRFSVCSNRGKKLLMTPLHDHWSIWPGDTISFTIRGRIIK